MNIFKMLSYFVSELSSKFQNIPIYYPSAKWDKSPRIILLFLNVDEIAIAATFLALDDSSYIMSIEIFIGGSGGGAQI